MLRLGRNYMPNILFSFKQCVNNVNNLLIAGGINSVSVSTKNQIQPITFTQQCAQNQFIHPTLQPFSTIIYTGVNIIFNLLNKSFTYFPQLLLMSPLKEI